jgi:hypothetical protein
MFHLAKKWTSGSFQVRSRRSIKYLTLRHFFPMGEDKILFYTSSFYCSHLKDLKNSITYVILVKKENRGKAKP